uniref:Uncharacterized protein n=1 Tax=Arundo donax TaxID=35708 RepID=A0A0A9BJ13_ARUDO
MNESFSILIRERGNRVSSKKISLIFWGSKLLRRKIRQVHLIL